MKEIKQGFIIFILFSIVTGLIYPAFITTIAQILWEEKANGSLIKTDRGVIGSKLIGQKFTSSQYFHGRPSAIDYKGSISGASNLGPTNKKLFEMVEKEIKNIRTENNLSESAKVPADLALSSASGLDPHISVEAALLQAGRISKVRKIEKEKIVKLINKHIEHKQLGFLGEERINVLKLNLELDNIWN